VSPLTLQFSLAEYPQFTKHSVQGIHHQNNQHELHQLCFDPTALQYRECIDGNSNGDENKRGNTNQDDKNDEDGNDIYLEFWPTQGESFL
jgi:hypothetical protein